MKKSKFLLILLSTVCFTANLQAQNIDDVLQTEFVFEIRAELDDTEINGETKDGVRQAIPITGGTFEGPNIRGDILPGGADYQLIRADGVMELKAVYMIRTDDGALINVINEGIIVESETGGEAYVRTSPKFWAPTGKYDWLNKSIFLSRISGGSDEPRAVHIRVYRVK